MGGIVSAISGMFAPKMPKIKTPSMPDPESPSLKMAAKKKVESRRKDGRAGTIFTSGSSGAYSGANLGGTA